MTTVRSGLPSRLPRAAAEAGLITAALVGAGRVITGRLAGLPAEDDAIAWLQAHRTPTLDRTTWALSTYSDTVPTILTACVLGAWRWRGTRSPREAAQPLAAISLETAVFMTAAAQVGRGRPDLLRMDRPAPTSSFPSGHTGATTALHLTLADIVAEQATGAGRFAPWGLRCVVPPLVAWSRLYRGMHHPSDVIVGLGVGVWSYRTVRRLLAS